MKDTAVKSNYYKSKLIYGNGNTSDFKVIKSD